MTAEAPTAILSAPPGRAVAGDRRGHRAGFNWPLVAGAYVVTAGLAIGKAIVTAKTTPLIDDTDDAMRLTTVRDLLAGQNWWDHLQRRLNVPFGAEIHWSHLVDAAIGGLMLLLRPFAGPMTETIAAYAWPLLLLAIMLTLVAHLAFRLGGREAILPAVVLPALSPALMTEFSPGRLDHDSWQIILLLLMAWGAIESIERPRFAILSGLAGALSLAIGIEGLPSVISAVLALSLIWVVKPERADALRGFGVSLALGTVAAQISQYPPSRWFEPACDEISFTYVAFAVGAGAALALLSVLPLGGRPAWQRLALGGALGGVLAAGLAKAFPLCLHGPYAALDPWLVENWLNHIAEAKPIWDSLGSANALTIGIAVPPLLGLVAIGLRVCRGGEKDRGQWLVLGLFLAVAVAVMVAEVRGGRLAAPLMLPAAGWLVTAARRRYLGGAKLTGALAMVGTWLGFAGLAIAVIALLVAEPFEKPAVAAAPVASAEDCLMPGAFSALGQLPAARVMAPVDLGSHILLFTPHSVVGAPYHRDQAGVLDTYRFLNGPIAASRQILAARGVTLVVTCPALPEMRGLPEAAPDSFVKLSAANALPAWLRPLSGPGDVLRIYAVTPSP